MCARYPGVTSALIKRSAVLFCRFAGSDSILAQATARRERSIDNRSNDPGFHSAILANPYDINRYFFILAVNQPRNNSVMYLLVNCYCSVVNYRTDLIVKL